MTSYEKGRVGRTPPRPPNKRYKQTRPFSLVTMVLFISFSLKDAPVLLLISRAHLSSVLFCAECLRTEVIQKKYGSDLEARPIIRSSEKTRRNRRHQKLDVTGDFSSSEAIFLINFPVYSYFRTATRSTSYLTGSFTCAWRLCKSRERSRGMQRQTQPP